MKKQIQKPDPTIYVTSDSSDFAWGGGARDGVSSGGAWNAIECTWHINVKELLAVFLTLKTFCKSEKDVHITVGIDNTTSVRYLNRQGGRKRALNAIAREIWLWALERNIWLSASHVPGVLNVEADSASRKDYALDSEWKLNVTVFQKIDRQFGPVEIDLFATRVNTQCDIYFAWQPDPNALAFDAFLQDWHYKIMYAFPPFSVIGRFLQRVESSSSREVLAILPLWPTQTWFARALRMSIDQPRILPCSESLVILPQDLTRVHPMTYKLNLTLFRLSGQRCRTEVFRQGLPRSSPMLGGGRPRHNIGHNSRNGHVFACQGKLIQCKPL